MGTNNTSALRWLYVVGYLGIVTSILACMAIGIGSTDSTGTLQIDNGTVNVVNPNGDLEPVAGTSTFELVGPLESMDPWVVAGKTIEINESTQIEDGLQVGDLVRVRGTILEDETWLAYTIELAEEQTDPIIVLIGTVDSIDPWVVNGMTLNVTADTVINGEITVGMLVRVEILLLEDGTWEVLSITPLGDVTNIEGCITIVATVVLVTEDEVQFLGWPSMPINPEVKIERSEGDEPPDGVILSSDDDVLVVLCPSEDGQIVIVQIIVIVITPPDDGGTEPPTNGEKVLVCHKPDKKGGHTLSIPPPAVPAHLGHGDKLGACP